MKESTEQMSFYQALLTLKNLVLMLILKGESNYQDWYKKINFKTFK